MEFKPITLDDKDIIDHYCSIRPIRSCEYNFTILYMWQHYYDVKFYANDKYLLFLEEYHGEVYSMMPLCKEAYFKEATEALWDYFKTKGIKLHIYVADEIFAKFIEKEYPDQFCIWEERDAFDYIYDGDKLRTLAGKKLHKKRNHLNAFMNEYGDRYEFKNFDCHSEREFCRFIKEWADVHGEEEAMIQEELTGLCRVLEKKDYLDVKIGSIFIDGEMKAFSMGSEILNGDMAVIHAEKADKDIRGLYQAINRDFLLHDFPNAKWVNREDDTGSDSLRQAKMSYRPVELLKKFTIYEKD